MPPPTASPSAPIVLPEKYYLTHFLEFVEFLKEHSLPLCDEPQVTFLGDFEKLSEDAQCVYLRVANRKGRHFHRDSLAYAEISDLDAALSELKRTEFLIAARADDLPQLLPRLDKPRLQDLVRKLCGQEPKKSWGRAQLVSLATERAAPTDAFWNELLEAFVSQGRCEELAYLKFLFFGELQDNLTLYTLRDLGVRRANTLRTEYSARFKSRPEARAQFFYASLCEAIARGDESPWPGSERAAEPASASTSTSTSPNSTTPSSLIAAWPAPQNSYTTTLRENALLAWGESLAERGQVAEACEVFAHCQAHPARERWARLLLKEGRREECQALLEKLLDESEDEAELTFAQDFLLRKFAKKRRHILTDMLADAPSLALDDSYLQSAEIGVQEHLRARGKRVFRSENDIWRALFGVYFWDELFETKSSGICGPFDRRPQQLAGPDFYLTHRESLENKLAALDDADAAWAQIQATLAARGGKLNGVFQWHASIPHTLSSLIRAAPRGSLAQVLREMALDFENRSTGFPDLLVIDESGLTPTLEFIEVKAQGDQLRPGQLQQIKRLRAAGFAVSLLKVTWHVDPNQTYVVVDVETTGGNATFNRLTEIGAVKVRNGQIIDTYSTLVNPERRIPRMITELTGISDDMVATAPRFAEVADAFAAFTEGSVFVAHNVRFDYGFIQAEFERIGQTYLRRKMCTVVSMRRTHPGLKSYSLKNLCQEFKVNLTSHHRALCDAQATAQLLFLINEKRARPAEPTVESAVELAADSATA